MSIKQTISTPIYSSPNGIAAIVDEANDGVKALPTELVVKKSDDSTFEQVSATNPLPVSGAVQLTGSNMEHYGLSTDPKPTTGLVKGMTFFEIDTTNVYMWDGTQWRLI